MSLAEIAVLVAIVTISVFIIVNRICECAEECAKLHSFADCIEKGITADDILKGDK